MQQQDNRCVLYKYKETMNTIQTHPKVGGSKAVRGRDIVGCLGGVSVVGVDVGQQRAHHRRNTWAHVLRRQAGKMTANERRIYKNLECDTNKQCGLEKDILKAGLKTVTYVMAW